MDHLLNVRFIVQFMLDRIMSKTGLVQTECIGFCLFTDIQKTAVHFHSRYRDLLTIIFLEFNGEERGGGVRVGKLNF